MTPTKKNIGILHPGAMGISIAKSAIDTGHSVYWISTGRSEQTHERAKKYELKEVQTIKELCNTCSILISVCPPHAAEEVADHILKESYQGIYIEANAISPQKSQRIGEKMQQHGIDFVDGGIVGGPAWHPEGTWLYLSGYESQSVAECFTNGLLETKVIGNEIGKASALKMCFAANSKGTAALHCAIVAAAEGLGVRDELFELWSLDGDDFGEKTNQKISRVTAKAWRFAGEMLEIRDTFETVGIPGEFHQAAADIYQRIASFKDDAELPPLNEVLAALLKKK